MNETHKFIRTMRHASGSVSTVAPESAVTQLAAIDAADWRFENYRHIEIIKLYRVDPETAELVHVQTWTRKEVAV